ncbi:MAG TPA: peptide chain release factor N(5)-glutamine methyltransferase [Acidimicrobiales bacterium]
MTPPDASVVPLRVGDVLASAADALGSVPQARWIVAQATGMGTGDLVARPDLVVAPAASDAVRAMVERCRAGEPLQYVLGTWAFRSLELRVDRRVLIPRPETEHVVEVALEELRAQAWRDAPPSGLVAVDLGTGSGAIALSLAAEFDASPRSVPPPPLAVWATDMSGGALEVFDENLATLAQRSPDTASRVHVAQGSWFDALPPALAGTVHLVVSNPPYVSGSEWEALETVVREHEPQSALVSGPTGVEDIELLLNAAPDWLDRGGSLVVELAPAQAPSMRARATEIGYETSEIRVDLAGRPRVLVARWPGA